MATEGDQTPGTSALWSRSPQARSMPLEQVFDHAGEELFVTEWRVVDRAHLDRFHWSVDSTPEAADTSVNALFPRAADNIDGVMLLSLVQAGFFNNYPFWSPGMVSYNYGFDRVRFPSTVYLEDELRLRVSLLDATHKPSGIFIRNGVTIEVNGRDRPGLVAEFLVLAAPA
jgi:acyl dehydratase